MTLNTPLFLEGEQPYRGSIEPGYAATARLISANPNPWGWNPTQYCGLPTQFTYLPALPYAAAAVTWIAPSLTADYAYRLVAATLACLGPVTLFFFVWYFTRSHWWALAVALAYTFLSPSYGLIRAIDRDRGFFQLPWRLQLMVKYGEGPHNAGLTLLPLAWIAVWVAATGRRYWQIFVAAVILALVTLTNWIAAVALAISILLMILAALGLDRDTGFRLRRVIAAAALAYLLACFWLTPNLVRTTAFNWPKDAYNYRLEATQWSWFAGLVAGLIVLRALFQFFHRDFCLCYVTLGFFAFTWIVVCYYSFSHDTLPESRRYTLEFELFLFLAVGAWLRLGLRSPDGVKRFCAISACAALLLSGTKQFRSYVTEGRSDWRLVAKEQTVEYRLARWLADHRPAGRVFASGGLRFRLNSWFDLHQVGGTFESGLRTRVPLDYAYQVRTGLLSAPGQEGLDAKLQLITMGVEYIVVHGAESDEYYRDFKNPKKLEGLLSVVHRERDDVIYRLPFRSLAHLVRREELPAFHTMTFLPPFNAALTDQSRPTLKATWRGSSELRIEGSIPEGMLVSVLVNHDPGWRAVQDDSPIEIAKDRIGFLTLHARPAAATTIRLSYHGAAAERWIAVVSLIAWIAAVGALIVPRLRALPLGKKVLLHLA